jgi:hypothetical protein
MRQTDIDEALVKRTNPTGAAEGQASKAPSVLLGLLANSRRCAQRMLVRTRCAGVVKL